MHKLSEGAVLHGFLHVQIGRGTGEIVDPCGKRGMHRGVRSRGPEWGHRQDGRYTKRTNKT